MRHPTMGTRRAGSRAGWVAGYAGLAVHGPLVVPLGASGLVAPMWAVGLLLATWAVLLVCGFVLLRRRPSAVPAIPLLMVALAVALMAIGGALLGWTT